MSCQNKNSEALISQDILIKKSNSNIGWFLWGFCASFYLIEYFVRLSPSLIINQLMYDFHVDAFQLGALSAFFYYSYVVMQIPVGLMLDRYKIIPLLALMAFLFAGAVCLFAFTHSYIMACILRAVMGFTAAFSFIGALKLANIWFPSNKMGMIAGLTQGLGMLGAAMGEGLIEHMLEVAGWRDGLLLIGCILMLLVIGLLILSFNKKIKIVQQGHYEQRKRLNSAVDKKSGLLFSLKYILKKPSTWINAGYGALLYVPVVSFGELWGVKFLQQAYHLPELTASTMVSVFFLGWAIGGPLIGKLSDKLGNRKVLMFMSAVSSLLLAVLVLYVPLNHHLLLVVLFLFGFLNTGVGLCYAAAAELHGPDFSGISLAFANMASVVGGALLQPLIGALLLHGWTGKFFNGVPYYSIINFKQAFFVVPFCLMIACCFACYLPKKG